MSGKGRGFLDKLVMINWELGVLPERENSHYSFY